MNNKIPLFRTLDLNLSAVLVSLDAKIEKIEKNQKGKSLFYFKQSKELNSIIEKYWKQELKVNPQTLFNSLKFIKNRIYSSY